MKQWEKFEDDCYEYLQNTYKAYHAAFKHNGRANSTVSDIAVIKNNEIAYFIETKMSHAQSGQFVLLPDEVSHEFTFSPKNKSTPNFLTDMITQYMNTNFDKFHKAGTTGVALDTDTNIFSEWIVNYYTKKNVKYFMTKGTSYIIFPIEKFGKYFDVTAKYRIKKSGSSTPAKKDIPTLIKLLEDTYKVTFSHIDGKKLFVSSSADIAKIRFEHNKFTYYLAPKNTNEYEVRKLSNTYNMNVIFSISLKQSQDLSDLKSFEDDLSN